MNQGYPNEGSDRRMLPGLGWLQKWSIIHPLPVVGRFEWRGWYVTYHRTCPPFFMAERRRKDRRVRCVRLGWTYRIHEGYYIFGLAFKKQTDWEWDYQQLFVMELQSKP